MSLSPKFPMFTLCSPAVCCLQMGANKKCSVACQIYNSLPSKGAADHKIKPAKCTQFCPTPCTNQCNTATYNIVQHTSWLMQHHMKPGDCLCQLLRTMRTSTWREGLLHKLCCEIHDLHILTLHSDNFCDFDMTLNKIQPRATMCKQQQQQPMHELTIPEWICTFTENFEPTIHAHSRCTIALSHDMNAIQIQIRWKANERKQQNWPQKLFWLILRSAQSTHTKKCNTHLFPKMDLSWFHKCSRLTRSLFNVRRSRHDFRCVPTVTFYQIYKKMGETGQRSNHVAKFLFFMDWCIDQLELDEPSECKMGNLDPVWHWDFSLVRNRLNKHFLICAWCTRMTTQCNNGIYPIGAYWSWNYTNGNAVHPTSMQPFGKHRTKIQENCQKLQMDFCRWGSPSNASACYASLGLIHCNNLKHSNFNFL
jgi:hypothetical protein